MSRSLARTLGLVGTVILAAATIAAACARDGDAQVARRDGETTPDDSAALSRLMSAVRGADPLLCEMAVHNVDMHGSWSYWGPLAGNPLDADTGAAQVIRWIQERHDDPTVVPRLAAAMHDPDACVRRVAGSFLGRVQHASARAALLAALDDASADTRYVAALGLGLGEVAEAQQPLTRRLRDDSPLVRRAAAWALGALEQPTAVAALIDVLQRDPDAGVRQAAAWAIGRSHE